LQDQFLQLQQEYSRLLASYQEQTASLSKLQASFKDYQNQVHKAQSKSIVFEIAAILLAAGWGLDALGVY
jgi:molecular chaperone GrpE (heat shock protein)